ncbi:MAG: DUF167 domain-containing protein [Methanobacterium sp.]|uniref:DUF167 family protein n=1 Tax=Methanobacterium sp. TaxID=2164 RepID=UPI003C786C58
MKAITPTKDGVLLNIEVSPNSDKFRITGYNQWRESVEVKIKALPQKGKANKEIITEFSKITKTIVEIISGHKSHHKTLKIYGISQDDLMKILNPYL